MTTTNVDRKIKFLVHSPGNWGNGQTIDEAIANCPGGKSDSVIYMWTGPEYPTKAYATPFGMEWEGTTDRPILMQDHRKAALKKKLPLEIGSPAP